MKKIFVILAFMGASFGLSGQVAIAKSTGTSEEVDATEVASEEKARRFFTDLEVVDQNGERLRFYTDVIKDKVVLINFLFTSCEDACPMVAQKLNQTRQAMVSSIRDDVWFVSVSVDANNDTPEAMKEFLRKQGADESRWLFLSGDKKNMDTIIYKLGQYTREITAHSTMMLAGNARTRHWTRVLPMTPPGSIAQQLRELIDEETR